MVHGHALLPSQGIVQSLAPILIILGVDEETWFTHSGCVLLLGELVIRRPRHLVLSHEASRLILNLLH